MLQYFCMAGSPEKPQTAAANGEVMLKRTIKQRLDGARVRVRQLHRKKKLQKTLFLTFLVTGINFLTVACGQGETLTLNATGTSAEETGEERATASETGTSFSFAEEGAAGSGNAEASGQENPDVPAEKPADAGAEGAQELLYVYVCGAVERPGVYSLPEDARVCDALAAAGGLTLEADETCVNQALKLADQDQIYIRTLEEREKAPESEEDCGVLRAGASSAASVEGEQGESGRSGTVKINLNTATREELMSLRGIGETKAEAILAYRQEHGFFGKPEDLKKVSGIGDATYEKLKDQITAKSP